MAFELSGSVIIDDSRNVVAGLAATFTGSVLFDNGADAGKDLEWQTANDRLLFSDDVKAAFGDNADLIIESNGSNSFIDEYGSSGKLLIRSNNQVDITSTGNASMIEMVVGGAVNLYHDGSKKAETTTHGIDITGHVETDTLRVSGISTFSGTISGGMTINGGNVDITDNNKIRLGSSNVLQMNQSGSNSFLEHTSASGTFYIQGDTLRFTNKDRDETYIECDDEAGVKLNYANTTKIETTSAGVTVTGNLTVTGTSPGGPGTGEKYVLLETSNSASDTGVNTLAGYNAGNSLTTADHTTLFGYQSGASIQGPGNNSFFGSNAGNSTNSGDNAGFGGYAMPDNNGEGNTAVGCRSMKIATGSEKVTSIGAYSFEGLTTGDNNIAIGYEAGAPDGGTALATGSNCILIGYQSAPSATDVSNEITLGDTNITKFRIPGLNFVIKDSTATEDYVLTVDASGEASWEAAAGGGAGTGEQFVYLKNSAGNLNDSGENVYAGYRAGASLASGSNENTFFGTDAGRYTATGDYNTYIGHRAGENSTLSSNVAVGSESLRNNSSGSGNNTAVGQGAAENLGTADSSIAIGYQALRGAGAGAGSTVTGVSNIAIGVNAGDALTSGSQNICIGQNAFGAATDKHWNVIIGKDCNDSNGGNGNVILGHDAGRSTSGGYNVVIGKAAGDVSSFSGDNNIIIGYNADPTAAATSNEITLGNTSISKFRIPGLNYLHNSTGVGIGTTNPSAMLDVGSSGIATANTVINAQAWDGQVFSVDGNITSDSVFAVNDISGLPVLDFNATHGNIALAPFGNNVSIGYTNAGTKLGLKGSTSERVYIVADELSDQTSDTINIDNGNVQYFTTAENGGTLTANITSNNGINNDLAIGDSTTVVVIIKPDSSSDKITNITIDGSAATEEWLGGSAPDGGASGSYDVYTFFILKTADATFLPLCNKVNFA